MRLRTERGCSGKCIHRSQLARDKAPEREHELACDGPKDPTKRLYQCVRDDRIAPRHEKLRSFKCADQDNNEHCRSQPAATCRQGQETAQNNVGPEPLLVRARQMRTQAYGAERRKGDCRYAQHNQAEQ